MRAGGIIVGGIMQNKFGKGVPNEFREGFVP